MSDTHSFTQL